MRRLLLAAAMLAAPGWGQSMPGMAMPDHPATGKPRAQVQQAPAAPSADPHAGHAMPMEAPAATTCSPEHAAMGHCQPTPAQAPPAAPAGTDQPAGNAPPPAAPRDRAADRFYGAAKMAAADAGLRRDHGGMRFAQVMVNLAEAQVRRGGDGYRWDATGWFGGDVDRFVVKSEGEGDGDRLDTAEVQALYARAIGPYFNLQAGVRRDLGKGARRSYATFGVEGLAPYWFDVEGTLFLSDRGDLLARAEAWYDQRITQRLILQPRVEVNLAAQDVPAARIAAGVSGTEAGLRLRYEIARPFAPYVGVSWERRRGESGGVAMALGVRGWF